MKKQMYLFALVVLLTGLIAGCAAPAGTGPGSGGRRDDGDC